MFGKRGGARFDEGQHPRGVAGRFRSKPRPGRAAGAAAALRSAAAPKTAPWEDAHDAFGRPGSAAAMGDGTTLVVYYVPGDSGWDDGLSWSVRDDADHVLAAGETRIFADGADGGEHPDTAAAVSAAFGRAKTAAVEAHAGLRTFRPTGDRRFDDDRFPALDDGEFQANDDLR